MQETYGTNDGTNYVTDRTADKVTIGEQVTMFAVTSKYGNLDCGTCMHDYRGGAQGNGSIGRPR